MLLPIETGCKAIIINSKNGNDGNVVTVGKFIGSVKGFWLFNNWWEIDKELPFLYGDEHNFAPEHMLMRIDGYKEQEQESKKETIKV